MQARKRSPYFSYLNSPTPETDSIFSLSIYHFAPLSLEMRQVLAVTVFAPVSTLAPIYTEKCKGDTAVSSFTASVSIVIGLFVMSGLAMWFRL